MSTKFKSLRFMFKLTYHAAKAGGVLRNLVINKAEENIRSGASDLAILLTIPTRLAFACLQSNEPD
jgi:hypothetical protein